MILTGYRTDVAAFYHMADIFLFPSYREGLPVAVMEAMASGLPVIATDIRGSRDLIEDGVNGVLLDPDDVPGFTQAIAALLVPEARRKFAENNLVKINEFDLKTVLQYYRSIYMGEGYGHE